MILLIGLVFAGKLAKDMDQVRQPTPGGWRYGWVAGRGMCPGDRGPSLRPAGDGRPCTYHDPSPLVGLDAWRAIAEDARQQDVGAWAAGIEGEIGVWVRGLPVDERAMAWEGLRAP